MRTCPARLIVRANRNAPSPVVPLRVIVVVALMPYGIRILRSLWRCLTRRHERRDRPARCPGGRRRRATRAAAAVDDTAAGTPLAITAKQPFPQTA